MKALITTEDVQRHFDSLGGPGYMSYDAEHLATVLNEIAQTRTDKRAAAGERLAEAAKGIETVVAFALARGVGHIGEQELTRLNDALVEYREVTS